MTDAATLILVALTSLGAWAVGTRRLGLETPRLRAAMGQLLQCLGLVVVFLAANLALGFAAIALVRGLTDTFVSMYVLEGFMLPVLSLLQALVFAWWQPGAPR